MATEKTFFDFLPHIISSIAVIISYQAYKNNAASNKDNFINMLRANINNAKHSVILLIEKEYTQQEKLSINESIQDLLLYQGYQKEKKEYLTKAQSNNLFNLQEEIEDYIGCILISTDTGINREQARGALNKFIETL